MLHVG